MGLKTSACICRWGKLWMTKYKKTKTPTANSEGQKQGTANDSCTHTCKGWANHLSYPLSPSHWSGPALTSFKAPAYPPSENKQGHLFHVFPPLWYNVSPDKALPEFLVWPFINFYWLKSPRRLVGNSSTFIDCWTKLLNLTEQVSLFMKWR